MEPRVATSFEDFLSQQIESNPDFADIYEETRIEGDLALALARLREQSGLTQRALAAKSGIKQPMIARIERAAQIPTATTLWRLLSALNAVAEIRPDGVTVRRAAPQPVSLDAWRAAQAVQWNARSAPPAPLTSQEGTTATVAMIEDRLINTEPDVSPQADAATEWEDIEYASNPSAPLQESAWAS